MVVLFFSGFLLFVWMVAMLVLVFVPAPASERVIKVHDASFEGLLRDLDALAVLQADAKTRHGVELAAGGVKKFLASLGYQGTSVSATPVATAGQSWNYDDIENKLRGQAAATAQPAATGARIVSMEVVSEPSVPAAPRQPIDQTLALLFMGAFLLIAAATLFLAYGGVGPATKVTIMALGVAIFYASGLYVHGRAAKFRPVALTFLAIGLLLLPVTGVGASRLLGTDGHLTWLVVSLVGLGLYAFAYLRLRSSLIVYVSLGMWFSLAASGAGVLDVPMAGYTWALLAATIVMQLLSPRLKAYDPQLGLPLLNSGVVAMAGGLLGSLLFLHNGIDLWQIGVSLALSAVYLELLRREAKGDERSYYAMAVHGSLLLGGLLAAYDLLDDYLLFGALLMLLALVHGMAVVVWPNLRGLYGRFVYYLGLGLSALAVLWVYDDARFCLMALGVVAVLGAVLYRLVPTLAALAATSAALYFVPFALAAALPVSGTARLITIAAAGFVVAIGGIAVRHIGGAELRVRQAYQLLYGLSLVTAFGYAAVTPQALWVSMFVCLLALLVFFLSYYERQPLLSLLPPALLGYSVTMLEVYRGNLEAGSQAALLFGLVMTALIAYLLRGVLAREDSRGVLKANLSIAALASSWLLSLTMPLALELWVPAALMAAFALLLGVEASLRRWPGYSYATIGLLAVLALLQWYDAYYGQQQSLNWAFYLLVYGIYCAKATWWLGRRGDCHDQYFAAAGTALVLGVFAGIVAPGLLPNGEQQHDYVALGLIGYAGVLYALRRLLRGSALAVRAAQVAYMVAFLLAWLAAMIVVAQPLPIAVMSVATAILYACLSYTEAIPRLFWLVPLSGFVAAVGLVDYLVPDAAWTDVALMAALVAGPVYALLSRAVKDTTRYQGMMVALALLAVLVFLVPWDATSLLPGYAQPMFIALTAGLFIADKRRLGYSSWVGYGLIAVVNASSQVLIHRLAPDTNWLVYSHAWAAYLAYVAWRLRQEGRRQEMYSLTYGALVVFSLPTALRALGDPTAYGLLLLAEHVALIVLGAITQKKLFTFWGIAVSILTVMYLLRAFGYVQLGIIAVTLIGYAVWRLGTSERHE